MAEDGEGEENLGQVGDQVVVQQDHLVWCEDDNSHDNVVFLSP